MATSAWAATPALTIVARAVSDPTAYPSERRVVALSGTATGARPGEDVIIEARKCGPGNFFRIVGAASASGGAWSARIPAYQGAHFRARFRDLTSETVTVRWPAPVHAYARRLTATRRRSAATRIHVVVNPSDATQNFRRRVVELQRRAADGNWVVVRRARLRQFASYSFLADFVVRQRGLLLRVFVPEASAQPCYLAGASEQIRS